MITRKVLFLDRLAILVLALALIAGGCLGIWWWSGRSPLVETTSTAPARDLVATSWWPWASAAVGVVLVILALRWILAHVSNNRVSRITLPGSGSTGRLSLDVSRAASAAAEAFGDTLGVRSAKGSIRTDRGQVVANIKAVIEPEADLGSLATRASEVSAELAQVIGRDDLRCSIDLTVARRGRALSRVS